MAISSKNNTILNSSDTQPSEITLTSAGSLIGAYYTKDKDSNHAANSFPFSKETVNETGSSVYRVHAPNTFSERNYERYGYEGSQAKFSSVNASNGMAGASIIGQIVEPFDQSKTLLLAGDHVKGISLLNTAIGSVECSGVLATISDSDWTTGTSNWYQVQYNFGYKTPSTLCATNASKIGMPNTYNLNDTTNTWQAILIEQGSKIYNNSVSKVVPRIIELKGKSTGLLAPTIKGYEWNYSAGQSDQDGNLTLYIVAHFGIKNENTKQLYLHYWIYDRESREYIEKSIAVAAGATVYTEDTYIGMVMSGADSYTDVYLDYMSGDADYISSVIQLPMYFSTMADHCSGETSQCIIIDYDSQNDYPSLWGDFSYDATNSSGVTLVPTFNASDIAIEGILNIEGIGSGNTCSSFVGWEI